jgi:hypothetical protein
MTKFRTMALAGITVLCTGGLALACPNCKEAVPGTDAAMASSFGSGINASIYYMFAGFFIALGMIVRVLYKGAKSTPVRIPVEHHAGPIDQG